MITGKLRKNGNSFVVTIPKEEIERLGLHEGDVLSLDVQRMELQPVLPPEIRVAYEKSFRRNGQGYRYLAGK